MDMDRDAATLPAVIEPVVTDGIWQLVRIRAERTPDRVLSPTSTTAP